MELAHAQLNLENESSLNIINKVGEISTINEIEQSSTGKSPQIYKVREHDIYFYNFEKATDLALMDSRLRAFVEFPGKKMLNDFQVYSQKIAGLHDDDGFDYSIDDIVKLFNEANKQKIKLNPWELQLEKQLQNLHLISKEGSQYKVVKQAAILGLVKASRGTADHELNHGIYFTDSAYKQQCDKVYASLSSQERQMIDQFIQPTDYEHQDQSLMAREMCATLRDWKTLTSEYFKPQNEAESQVMAKLHRKILDINNFSQYYRDNGLQPKAGHKNSLKGVQYPFL